MFYLAAFPQFITLDETTALASFLLVVIHSIINAIWFGTMVLVMSRLVAIPQNVRFQRWLKGITGVVFLGFAAKLATYKSNI